MIRRSIEGIGEAIWLPHEERFAQRLLRSDSPTRLNELAVIHALKVETGGCLLPEPLPDPAHDQMELTDAT